MYCEVAVGGLDGVKRAGGFAKLRTGGVKPEAIPGVGDVAAFIVAAQAGMAGTAKNAQDEALLWQTSHALFDYLDSLKP